MFLEHSTKIVAPPIYIYIGYPVLIYKCDYRSVRNYSSFLKCRKCTFFCSERAVTWYTWIDTCRKYEGHYYFFKNNYVNFFCVESTLQVVLDKKVLTYLRLKPISLEDISCKSYAHETRT